jgi:hypothetical protein
MSNRPAIIGTSPSEFGGDPFFAFGSAWVVDANWSLPLGWSWSTYDNNMQQEQPSINLLRIDLVTKNVIAIIPLPRLGFIFFQPAYTAFNIVQGYSMCEGAGKLWVVFGNGAEGPWGAGYDTSEYAMAGDANDYAAQTLENQYWQNLPPGVTRPRGVGHVRGLVYSIDPTDNVVKTINPLDNRVDYPQIAFGGGFVWVSQTPILADVLTLNYYHGFSRQNWSPLLRIDPSSSYSLTIPQGQYGIPDPTPRHPTLRVFPDGLSEQPFPTPGVKGYGEYLPTGNYLDWNGGYQGATPSAFNIFYMFFGDGHLVMSTFDAGNAGSQDNVSRISRLNVSNLQVKKGPIIDLYNIIFCPLNNTIWGATYNNDDDEFGAELGGEIWVGDMDLNFTKVPIEVDSWIGLARPEYAPVGVAPDIIRIGFVFGLAFDGIEVFASMIIISGWNSAWADSESVILRISPKSKTIKSIISFELPNPEDPLEWYYGGSAIIRIIYAEDGVLWCNRTLGSKTFPIKQGRFGGWKVGKI